MLYELTTKLQTAEPDTGLQALQRPVFTAAQKLQAAYIGRITDAQRKKRDFMSTHPIDNVEPHIVADRDDGIFVDTEAHSDGGYRVHITIADVASYIRLKNPLTQTALLRGFTVYGPGWTDPMFPKSLEEQMSLEHMQERLGFSITLDLNRQYTPVHTEFRPVITKPDSMSYAQAADRMDADPQLQKMAYIARGIRRHYFTQEFNRLAFSDGLASRYGNIVPSNNGHNAIEMVATYAVLANNCMAEFFYQTQLPYMYRNFDAGQAHARARYQPHNKHHDALSRDFGLLGAYGHFTSPLRRAPDLLNLYMAHFAFDVLRGVENIVTHHQPSVDQNLLHRVLWGEGKIILNICATQADAGEFLRNKQAARKTIINLLKDEMGLSHPASISLARSIITYLTAMKPPLSRADMQRYADRFNSLTHAPQTRIIAKQHQASQELENLDKDTLAVMDKKSFSSKLRKAALLGDIPRVLYNEALARIIAGRHDPYPDEFSILILAIHPHIPRWDRLKREVLRRIKHSPGNVTAIIQQSRTYFGADILQERDTSLCENPDAVLTGAPNNHIYANIITLRQNNQISAVAAPFYSVGHNPKAAKSHAQYSFIEHFAFGELQPVEQISMPNIMYADLDSGEKSKRFLVEEMVVQAGGKIQTKYASTADGFTYHLYVSGGDFPVNIAIEGAGKTIKAAEASALRRLLRHWGFKHTVASAPPVALITNPQNVLADMARERGYDLEISPPLPHKTRGFETIIKIMIAGKLSSYSGHGPNKPRAVRDAVVKALRGLGRILHEEMDPDIDARSWSTETERSFRDHERKLTLRRRAVKPRRALPAHHSNRQDVLDHA